MLIASASAVLARSTAAIAQDETDIGSVVISSGGFTPIEEQEFGHAASVITTDEIEQRGIATVQVSCAPCPV